jgi:hypothetical protein
MGLKRISLSERDAAHAYEWLRMYWEHAPEITGRTRRFGNCALCEQIGKRLERFIGPAEVRRVARVVKRNPGTRKAEA